MSEVGDVERLAVVFRALGNPERLTVLAAVAASEQGLSISEVCAMTGLPRLAATRHLKRLRLAGIVASRWERPSHIHWLDERAVEQVEDWVYGTLREAQLLEPAAAS